MNYNEFTTVQKDHQSLVDKFDWLLSSGLNQYEAECLKIFKLKSLPKISDENIIEQTIYKTLQDYNRKIENKTYYISNSTCFINIIKYILSPTFIDNFKKHKPQNINDLLIYNYYHLFDQLLFEAAYNLSQYEIILLKKKPSYEAYKPLEHHSFQLYVFVNQIIFGQNSFHSYADREPELAISIIRQMIELRIKNAFGIIGLYNKKTDVFEPLPMNIILTTIKKYQRQIDFSASLDCIIRVYSWTNIYIHGGIKDYIWKMILISKYLKTFMSGKKIGSGSSIDWGIITTNNVITNIQNDIKTLFNSDKKSFFNIFLNKQKNDYELVSKEIEVKIISANGI